MSLAFLPNYPHSLQIAKIELGKETCCIGVIIAQICQKKYKNLIFRNFLSRIFAKLSSFSANGEGRVREKNLLSRGNYRADVSEKVT